MGSSRVEISGSTFNGPVNATAAGGNIGSVTQTVNVGVDVKAIAEWLTAIQALVPVARLPAAQLERLEAAVADVQTELDAQQQNPSMIQRAGRALLAALPEAVASSALAQAPMIFAGVLEAGGQLFG